jgi:Flp pilus assembly protein TadD
LFKETALVFVPLLLAVDLCLPERQRSQLVKTLGAFAIIAVAYLAIRHAALGSLATVDHSRPFTKLLVTWPSLIWFYIGKLLFPFRLTYLHDIGFVDSATSIRFIFPVLAILVFAGAALYGGLRDRRIWLAASVILIPIIPPLLGTWVYNEYDLVHDRYLYLPVFGFCLLIALALEHLRSTNIRKVALSSVAAAYFFTVLFQGWIYTNNFTVFSRATDVASGNPLGWELLGEEYMKLGDTKRAIASYEAALARDPGFWLANFNLGRAFFESNDPTSAEVYFRRASRKDGYLDPASRGRQYFYLGLSQFRQRKLQEAEESLNRALKDSPNGMGYNFAMGQVMQAAKRFEEAKMFYEAEFAANHSAEARLALQRLQADKR